MLVLDDAGGVRYANAVAAHLLRLAWPPNGHPETLGPNLLGQVASASHTFRLIDPETGAILDARSVEVHWLDEPARLVCLRETTELPAPRAGSLRLMVRGLRARSLACTECGSLRVVRSHRSCGAFARAVGLRAYRCADCLSVVPLRKLLGDQDAQKSGGEGDVEPATAFRQDGAVPRHELAALDHLVASLPKAQR